MKITIAILLGVCVYFGLKSHNLSNQADLNWDWYQHQLKVTKYQEHEIIKLGRSLTDSQNARVEFEKSVDEERFFWRVLTEVKVGERKIQVRTNH